MKSLQILWNSHKTLKIGLFLASWTPVGLRKAKNVYFSLLTHTKQLLLVIFCYMTVRSGSVMGRDGTGQTDRKMDRREAWNSYVDLCIVFYSVIWAVASLTTFFLWKANTQIVLWHCEYFAKVVIQRREEKRLLSFKSITKGKPSYIFYKG